MRAGRPIQRAGPYVRAKRAAVLFLLILVSAGLLHLLSFREYRKIFDNQILLNARIGEGGIDYSESPRLYGLSSQSVISYGRGWRIYFVNYRGFVRGRIRGMYTFIDAISSGDGRGWRRLPLTLENEDGERLPFSGVDPCVVSDPEGGYRIYFVLPSGPEDPAGLVNEIRVATSRDGTVWRLVSGACLKGKGVVDPDVVSFEGGWLLYFTRDSREGGGIYVAASGDGSLFLEKGKVADYGSVSSASVHDGMVEILYQRYRRGIFRAKSRDGINFEDEERVLPLKYAMSPSIIHQDQGLSIYFLLNPPLGPLKRLLLFTARGFSAGPFRYPFKVALEEERGG